MNKFESLPPLSLYIPPPQRRNMQREDLEGMTVANLKVLLSELSLPVSGKKADLIERILQNQSSDAIDVEPSLEKEIDDANQDHTREDIETVVSNMVEGRIVNEHQLKENLGCIEVAKRLTENHMETIDEILGNKPDPWVGPGGDGNRELKTI